MEFLAQVAGPGPVLELGIGTGRIALPLAERGLEVHGIDASEEMVSKLRAKPGGDAIQVTIGDFADVGVQGAFPLVFVVFNTLFALLTQENQLRCFQGVAQHLTEDGVFVVQAFVPDLARFDRSQRVQAFSIEVDSVRIDASIHDLANQRIDAQLIQVTGEGVRMFPVQLRYAWPSELDLMARLAGLQLRERWSGWDRAPFTSASTSHVSLYERAR